MVKIELTDNQKEAIRLLGAYTAGRFDIWELAGNAKASCRAHIMSALNGKRTPQSKSGVYAMYEAFFSLSDPHFPKYTCNAVRESNFIEWARAVNSIGKAA